MSTLSNSGLRPRFTRREALGTFGLDVTYERAEGSRLWYRDPAEREVWDFLGGYGSTFFGHNHPELCRAAVEFIQERGVVHGQASIGAASERLVTALARRLHESTGGSFQIVLANTGAEAVEIAARHADESFARKRDALAARLVTARTAGAADPLEWTREALDLLRTHGIEPGPLAPRLIAQHNRRLLQEAPRFLAAHRSYHGMSARALSLTDDPRGRFGRGPRMPGVRFVDTDPCGPNELSAVLDELQGTLLRVLPGVDRSGLEALPWTPVAGFFFEPIQGEGGIHPLAPEVAQAWQAACAQHGVALIADEIQSGLGRSGTFLYCEQLGLRPDYVLLGKSLGGGLAKLSAVAIASSGFVPGFTLQHASTFAGDELSSRVATRALELLDEDSAAAVAQRKGERLLACLRALAARYPNVIAEVRGRGLMLGIEWRSSEFTRSNALEDLRTSGWLGYALAGYLLRVHGIRVAPTLSCRATLRLEPAYSVPDEALAQLLAGLEQLCRLLHEQDAAAILGPCMGLQAVSHAHVTPTPLVRRAPLPESHVGFVGHVIDAADLALWDASFARLSPAGRGTFLDRIQPFVEPVVTHRDHLTSTTGKRTTLTFIGLAVPSTRFHGALRTGERLELRDLVQAGVDLAAAEGCSVVGLGGYCSIVTRNGKDLRSNGLALTTGNGYTVGAGLEAMRAAACEAGIRWRAARAAVVGATGNIGSVLAELLASEVSSLVLLGRESRRADLETLAGRIVWSLAHVAPQAPMARILGGVGAADAPLPQNGGWAALYRSVRAQLGGECPIEVGSDLRLCRGARLIATASNEAGSVLFPAHLDREPVVINDVAVPADVDPSVARERPEARVIRGGVIVTPCNPDWRVPGVPLQPGEMYACLAETALMGFEGHVAHGSFGRLTPERVRTTLAMAARHGFSAVRSKVESSY